MSLLTVTLLGCRSVQPRIPEISGNPSAQDIADIRAQVGKVDNKPILHVAPMGDGFSADTGDWNGREGRTYTFQRNGAGRLQLYGSPGLWFE